MQIIIIDLGSQYTLVISRVLRELGVRSVILSPEKAKSFNLSTVKGIILSGGDKSVCDIDAPAPPLHIFHEEHRHIPLLGICYGMQYIAYYYNGGRDVIKGDNKNYGESYVAFEEDPLTVGLFTDVVWASHSDNVVSTPDGFNIIARYDDEHAGIAGISSTEHNIWGIQFHPEVTHTVNGKQLLRNFLFGICKCEKDWKPADIVDELRDKAHYAVGNNKCVLGFSGGVDSTTLAAIVAPVFKERVRGICIDTGGLRMHELDEIEEHANAAGIDLTTIHAEFQFRQALKDITDAEHKRKNFKALYREIFKSTAERLGAGYIIQGSIAPDVIESGAVGSAALIKSHHNIGHTWDELTEVPLMSNLFKYEVRELAKFLNLPDSVVYRHPFPGPGLFLRIIGAPITPERLDIVRVATQQATLILQSEGIYDKISQLVVALMCINTVGIKGDKRTYGPSIVVRAVETQDFMTVKGFQIPDHIRRRIASEISKHPDISRVWFDEMDKPPATVEFE